MARGYTCTDIIASVKRRALLSSAGSTPFTDADWLALMDEEIRATIWPMLRELSDEWLVTRHDFTVTSGQASYRLPPDVMGEAVKAVMVSGTGNDDDYAPLTRAETGFTANASSAFWLEDDSIWLTPDSRNPAGLRLLYWRRPGLCVASDEAGEYTGNGLTSVQAVISPGANFSPNAGDVVDFVGTEPGFRILWSPTVAAWDSGTGYLDLTTDLPAVIGTSGWVTMHGESYFPPIPVECHPLLAQCLVTLCLEGRAGYAEATKRRDELFATTRALLANRTEAHPRYVQNYDAPGWGGFVGFRRRAP